MLFFITQNKHYFFFKNYPVSNHNSVSKIYDNGKYCTFPHAIELLNKKYSDIFMILTYYPDLENYLSPFMDA